MSKLFPFFKSLLISISIFGYLFFGVFFLLPNTHIHNMVPQTDHCHYVLGSESFCQMNILEYINLWRQLTFVTLTQINEIIILFIFAFYFSLIYLASSILISLIYEIRQNDILGWFDFLLIRQIINPRAP